MISIGNLQINKLYLGDVEVTKAYLGDVKVYDTTQKYMTITVDDAAGETTISPTVTGSLPNLNLQYRVNNGGWNDFIVGTTADIHAVAGDFVQFKGVNESGLSTSNSNYLNFAISGLCNLSGNVMSLIDGIGDTLVIPNNYCFTNLFKDTKIKNVTEDFLPATTLKDRCYVNMFRNCSSLVTAPALPATVLSNYCYANMFRICSSLVTAPALPATVLTNFCYNSMFYDCISLTQAPDLPALVTTSGCYSYMFKNCTSLNYVKSLATYISANNALYGWLSGVSSTGTFVKPNSVSYPTGESGIPEGWTVEEI